MPRRSRLVSFRDAVRGVGYMLREEPNMRFHVAAATGVVVAAAALRLDAFEWAACIFAIVLVLLAEILNTAVESLLDIVHPGQHPLVGVVKDLAAGAVLVASAGATVIALLVFVPAVWNRL